MNAAAATGRRASKPRRLDLTSVGYNALALLLAIGVAVVIGGLAVELSGHSAIHAYNLMLQYAACNKAGGGGEPCTADSVIDIINRAIPYYLSALAVANGSIGFGYHVRGVLRRPGGTKKLVRNVIYGPPIFAPLLFAASGFLGLLASVLGKPKR